MGLIISVCGFAIQFLVLRSHQTFSYGFNLATSLAFSLFLGIGSINGYRGAWYLMDEYYLLGTHHKFRISAIAIIEPM